MTNEELTDLVQQLSGIIGDIYIEVSRLRREIEELKGEK